MHPFSFLFLIILLLLIVFLIFKSEVAGFLLEISYLTVII